MAKTDVDFSILLYQLLFIGWNVQSWQTTNGIVTANTDVEFSFSRLLVTNVTLSTSKIEVWSRGY